MVHFSKTGDPNFWPRWAILRVFIPMLGGILAGLILLLHTIYLVGRSYECIGGGLLGDDESECDRRW